MKLFCGAMEKIILYFMISMNLLPAMEVVRIIIFKKKNNHILTSSRSLQLWEIS